MYDCVKQQENILDCVQDEGGSSQLNSLANEIQAENCSARIDASNSEQSFYSNLDLNYM